MADNLAIVSAFSVLRNKAWNAGLRAVYLSNNKKQRLLARFDI